MWLAYAVLASALWGLDYALAERVLKKISISTLFAMELFLAFVAMLGLSYFSGALKKDINAVFSSRELFILFAIVVISFVFANYIGFAAIHMKNATIASLVEISYPLFIALFSWAIFKENQLAWNTALGGVLVFCGIFVIYFFNR